MRIINPTTVGAFLLTLSMGLTGLTGSASRAAGSDPADNKKVAAEEVKGHGFDTANLDQSCKPCQDFNQFANGGWIEKNPVPAAYSRWGRFNILAEQNREALHKVLEAAKANTSAPKGSVEQKIGDFYCSCMDTDKIEAAGIKPITPELDKINAIRDQAELTAEIAHLHTLGINVFFGFGSTQDAKDSTRVIAEVAQSGLGLPDRDYYTKDDDHSKEIRAEYVKHIAKMFELAGDDAAKAATEANTVLAFETRLAEVSMTRIQRRDPNATYNKMNFEQLQALSPNFSWSNYLKAVNYKITGDINVAMPDFIKGVDKQITATPLPELQTYMRWHVLRASAPRLSSAFVDENFHFYGTILTGAKENLERWKRCVSATDNFLGEALGQVYVEKYFSAKAKTRALEMVKNLQAALRDDLTTLNWMSDKTRKEALLKLDTIFNKIGYPDKWRDYSAVNISRNDYVGNISNSTIHEFRRDLNKISKPIDKGEWLMTPPTVNAYYYPLFNEIVFPAGILQPPFFDPEADDAINYGGIGAVIGHELTHGFDDQGRQFDEKGNLRDWWTADDLKNFQERASCIENQFDGYEVEKDLHMTGKLVLGESIADLGGLTIALAAYQKSLEGKPRPKDADGFTPEQRFFLGWAQVWANNSRPEALRLQVNTDPHPIARFRVNGPLSNMPAFAKAFSCKENDPMVRATRCQIW